MVATKIGGPLNFPLVPPQGCKFWFYVKFITRYSHILYGYLLIENFKF